MSMLAPHDPTLAQTPRQYAKGMAADNAEWLRRKREEIRAVLMNKELVGVIDSGIHLSRHESWDEVVEHALDDVLTAAINHYEQTAEG